MAGGTLPTPERGVPEREAALCPCSLITATSSSTVGEAGGQAAGQ